jgi:uncharacterized membrane protein YraQ (UPF0718 family)
MHHFFSSLYASLWMSLGMFWQIAWSLALGFTVTSVIEVMVSRERIISRFGKSGIKEVALATVFGALSSSCSYAAASTSRSLFKKGASLVSSLAFLFSSTNLVIELGIILWLFMGWQFALAEWIGGIVLISIMSLVVKLTYPEKMVEEARSHEPRVKGPCCSHDHGGGHGGNQGSSPSHPAKRSFPGNIADRANRKKIAANYFMEWSMLWKDLVVGLVIAGLIAGFVPQHIFDLIFLKNAPEMTREWVGTLIGPVLAILTFVCSIGNVPLAAIFWTQGMGFSGVLSFLYADLIVIPLLDIYRKYYGWRMAGYIFIVFFSTMAISGLVMSWAFHSFHLVPGRHLNVREELTQFRFNYTFYLNLLFGILSLYFFLLAKKVSSGKPSHTRMAG